MDEEPVFAGSSIPMGERIRKLPVDPIQAKASSTGPRQHLPSLDGLRALAVMAVLASHADIPRLGRVNEMLKIGGLGVDVFFVLSGFLITWLLALEHESAGSLSLRKFYARRALRLLPAALVVSLICGFHDWRSALVVTLYAANWAHAFGMKLGPLAHAWSLSLEEQFYACWPLLFLGLLATKWSRQRLVLLVLSLSIATALLRTCLYYGGASPERLYVGLDTRADSLLVGCALGLAFAWKLLPKGRLAVLASRASVGATTIFFAALLALGKETLDVFLRTLGYWFVAVAVGAVLTNLLVDSHSALRPLFENPVSTWIGRRSYGIYLWHVPLLWLLGSWEPILLELGVRPGVSLVLALSASVAAAAISYRYIESPFLRLKPYQGHG